VVKTIRGPVWFLCSQPVDMCDVGNDTMYFSRNKSVSRSIYLNRHGHKLYWSSLHIKIEIVCKYLTLNQNQFCIVRVSE